MDQYINSKINYSMTTKTIHNIYDNQNNNYNSYGVSLFISLYIHIVATAWTRNRTHNPPSDTMVVVVDVDLVVVHIVVVVVLLDFVDWPGGVPDRIIAAALVHIDVSIPRFLVVIVGCVHFFVGTTLWP
jgi:hypothetical protein